LSEFIWLPSGVVVNLALVTRMAPADEEALTLHFQAGETLTLSPGDASVLRKGAAVRAVGMPSAVRMAIFWIVILCGGLLVYLATRNVR